eukprot:COSAG06_NODE_1301_length_9938_cov_49.846834_2_plen_95_part_00
MQSGAWFGNLVALFLKSNSWHGPRGFVLTYGLPVGAPGRDCSFSQPCTFCNCSRAAALLASRCCASTAHRLCIKPRIYLAFSFHRVCPEPILAK